MTLYLINIKQRRGKIRHMFEYLITRPMGFIIEHIYNLVSNYGLAIIIFTILIKLILIPLNIHSQKAMKETTKKYSRLWLKLSKESNANEPRKTSSDE